MNKRLGKPVKVLDSLPLLIVCIAVVSSLYVVCLTGVASNNAMRYMIQIFLYITKPNYRRYRAKQDPPE